MINIGENIKKIRKEVNLNQQDFSEKIGISRSYLGDLENNRKSPSVETLSKIADNMNVSLNYLMTGKKSILDYDNEEQGAYLNQIVDDSRGHLFLAKNRLDNDIISEIAHRDIIKIYHNWENEEDSIKELLAILFGLFEEKPNDKKLHQVLGNFILELYASDQESLEGKLIILDRKYESIRKWIEKKES